MFEFTVHTNNGNIWPLLILYQSIFGFTDLKQL